MFVDRELIPVVSKTANPVRVGMVYDNDNQNVAWLTAHHNGVLVMTKGASNSGRDASMKQVLISQVNN